MNKKEIIINYQVFDDIDQLSENDQILCGKAKEALKTSHSPYSKFKVGTAIQLADDQIILGSNQENVAYPSGLCAERVALFYISSNNPNAVIKSMAITAHTDLFDILNPVTSCGACLQVMIEAEKKQGSPISVIFYALGHQVLKVESVKSLIPFAFVEDRLAL
jgi:cytidine deaminase